MFQWLRSLRRQAPAAASRQQPLPPVPMPPAAATAQADATPALGVWCWLFNAPPPQAGPLRPQEARLLAALDRQLAAPALPPDLVPRAPAVVPQLLSLLRQAQPSRAAMVDQVVKDMQLTAEVLRLARSPHFGALPIETLEQALDRIGHAGLQSAMARVLLKPVFRAQAGGLIALAAPRAWQLAEFKSLLCAQIVAQEGGERFQGFLAGLLHDTGTLALLRLLDRAGAAPALLPLSEGFAQALAERRDHLFGRITASWDLSPALAALAQHLRGQRPAAELPLARALATADQHAAAELARSTAVEGALVALS